MNKDAISNRKLLTIILSKRGISCDVVSDGTEAINIINANLDKYNIIFMDNLMSTMVCHILMTFALSYNYN